MDRRRKGARRGRPRQQPLIGLENDESLKREEDEPDDIDDMFSEANYEVLKGSRLLTYLMDPADVENAEDFLTALASHE